MIAIFSDGLLTSALTSLNVVESTARDPGIARTIYTRRKSIADNSIAARGEQKLTAQRACGEKKKPIKANRRKLRGKVRQQKSS